MQGWAIMKLSLFYVFFFLTINLVQAARFIRNAKSSTCLEVASPPTSSCSPVTLNSCPVDRFAKFSESLKWNLIPLDPSSPLTNSSIVMISSDDNKLCLSTVLNNVQACPCDNGIGQRWTLNNDKILSNAKGNCLSLIGQNVGIENCQVGGSIFWKVYHTAPNAVNLYSQTQFTGKSEQLFINDYNSKTLPAEIFSTPFSVEIPPGFELIIDRGNRNVETFDSDIVQISPINSLTSVSIKIKSGMIIYEHPSYFSTSQFIQSGIQISSIPKNSASVGSVLVPKGFRSVVWSSSNFTGDNLGLFEPIANFTGMSVNFASLDVSATTCKNQCGSGGYCSDEGICKCKPGFTGDRCESCLPGFVGQNCQKCQCATLNKNVCDQETGECKCNPGFIGVNCDKCAPGFLGPKCKACDCVNGACNAQGTACICNAGFAVDANNQCTTCADGFYKFGNDCKVCPPGCSICQNGICTQCNAGLTVDSTGACVKNDGCDSSHIFKGDGTCTPCDPSCATCSKEGPGSCLSCLQGTFYLDGFCITPTTDGGCTNAANQSFFASVTEGICETCPGICLSCSNPQGTGVTCTKCVPGLFLDNGKCVKVCPEGEFADITDSTCKVCDSSCASCKGPGVNGCTKCQNKDFSVFDGSCTSKQCPSGFVALDGVCTKCHGDCLECSGLGIDKCTKCPPNRPILENGQCVEVCPMGFYADKNENCQKCNPDCSSCAGPGTNQCLGCNDQTKVLIGGTCNGSCPSGSKLNEIERLCQSLDSEGVIPPVEINKQQQGEFKFEWWQILLITIGLILFAALVLLLIRYLAVRRRKRKTKELGDQIDDNEVAQNLKNLLRNSRGISQPEMAHPRSPTPPAYDEKDGESFWKNKEKQRHQKHMSITTDDYNKWKMDLKDNKLLEGLEEGSSSSSNAEYSGYNQGESSKNVHRNSKGSIKSNRSNRISTKRSYSIPAQKGDSWDEWV